MRIFTLFISHLSSGFLTAQHHCRHVPLSADVQYLILATINAPVVCVMSANLINILRINNNFINSSANIIPLSLSRHNFGQRLQTRDKNSRTVTRKMLCWLNGKHAEIIKLHCIGNFPFDFLLWCSLSEVSRAETETETTHNMDSTEFVCFCHQTTPIKDTFRSFLWNR